MKRCGETLNAHYIEKVGERERKEERNREMKKKQIISGL